MEDNNHQEEIDMIQILKNTKNAFSDIIQSIANVVTFPIVYFKTILLFVLIGIGIGVGMYFIKRPVYITSLSIISNRFNNDNCIQLINTLEDITDDKNNSPILAKKLNISHEYAEQVKSIVYEPLNAQIEKLYKDSISRNFPFKITVKVYNVSILDSLQAGILHYLEFNDYLLKRKEIKKQSLEKFGERIKNEIIALDSLKRIVNQSIVSHNKGTGLILGEPLNPVTVYQKTMELYKIELTNLEDQELNNSFEVLDGFTKFIQPSWPKLWLNLLLGSFLGYLFGIQWVRRVQKNKPVQE